MISFSLRSRRQWLSLVAVAGCFLGQNLGLQGQSYIVPNGVVTNYISGEISVIHDPTNHYYTGFRLDAVGVDLFQFNPVADIGVRVFLVSPNDPVSLQPILA